jgi:hypothetical protein
MEPILSLILRLVANWFEDRFPIEILADWSLIKSHWYIHCDLQFCNILIFIFMPFWLVLVLIIILSSQESTKCSDLATESCDSSDCYVDSQVKGAIS